ncbi:glucosamine-6-phosphate deaminase [Roseibium marinum]|uniref:Glucosamine-6-phosphate deaminase n=1 Tax=Roseibium marinum TaxID=281252 RepID=A0A2S3UYR3_9HYPH|nr:glucosamine-6-phosphate deaminase [Roseibium marinum]POF32750.1 glucosamine-6-phosphate deaminase [Roseibium marinum]
MRIEIHEDGETLGQAAAEEGARAIGAALATKGRAAIIVATGASQFETLQALVTRDLDWSRVTAFHLDEYVGIGTGHPASFRRYLRERFTGPLGNLGEFVEVNGDAGDLEAEIARLNARIAEETIDVCFAGIGENCHLAFNDPPADFETVAPYITVELDEACRRQQFGEGWFPALEDVPARAISMSIRRIAASRKIILSVPDERKAKAVANAVEGEVTNMHPASILQRHADCSLHLDRASAGLLSTA